MENNQVSELPLEQEFKVEQMRRFLIAKPEEAQNAALELYEAYLILNAKYLKLDAEKMQLQQKVKSRLETPPFFGR